MESGHPRAPEEHSRQAGGPTVSVILPIFREVQNIPEQQLQYLEHLRRLMAYRWEKSRRPAP